MAQLKQCANGHYFDPSMYSTCPYCSGKSSGIDRSIADYNIKTSNPLSGPYSSTTEMLGTETANSGATVMPETYINVSSVGVTNGRNGVTVPPADPLIQDTDRTTIIKPGTKRQPQTDVAHTKPEQPDIKAPEVELPERYVVGWLVAVEGPYTGKSFEIFAGNTYIGRAQGDVMLPKDGAISHSKNANTVYDDRENCFYLVAGQSTNLVRVNGKLLPSTSAIELHPYDLIEMGMSKFRFVPFCSDQFQW